MVDSDKKTERRDMLGQSLIAIEQLEKRLDAEQARWKEPIAIVGMSCRYPGAPSLEDYWKLLVEGTDAVTQIPPDRWADVPEAPDLSDAFGGFLENIDQFDAAHFGISGREAETMDPQQRLMLELSWEALEHAGIAPDTLRNSKTGVYVGVTTNDYARLGMSAASGDMDVYTATGGALNAAAGRVAYTLGLNGPAMAIDTACSSSLVALHAACQALRYRECDAAIAGGVNALLAPEPFICFANWGMMAPDGRCKTFDEKADGFVRSEGCGLVILKRLSDATDADDNILAVIRGTAVNQDGASSGLTVPNGLAQEAVLLAALEAANINPAALDYVEAHGTGTTLGDPIELEAIAKIIARGRQADKPLYVGSVKTNIGHAESASGIAGVIKVVLGMQNDEIPKQLHFNKLNPMISLRGAPIAIPTSGIAWPRNKRARLAGISSFGFSGTNAHVIIEESPEKVEHSADVASNSHEVLVLSARTDDALRQMASDYRDFLSGNTDATYAEVCGSAAMGRAKFTRRLALVASDRLHAAATLEDFLAGRDNSNVFTGESAGRQKIAFLFTGQGSQYVGMGHELYRTEPVFRECIDQCAELSATNLSIPLHKILGYGESAESSDDHLNQTEFAQPALFAIEYSLARLWCSWGVTPSAVAGHSLGEYVAACVAGVVSLTDALRLVIARAKLMQALPKNGAMATVFTDLDTARHAISSKSGDISIAAVNAPASVVISGESGSLQAVLSSLNDAGIESRNLTVSHAFHSPMMAGMLDEFSKIANDVSYSDPQIDLVLNEHGRICGENEIDADYWARHILNPVQFLSIAEQLQNAGITNYLEIGPAPVLVGLVGQLDSADSRGLFASMREGQDPRVQMRKSLAEMFARGIDPDWRAISGRDNLRRINLPRYPFQRKRFWLKKQEVPIRNDRQRSSKAGDIHPFLGHRMSSPLRETVFESYLSLSEMPSLRDHSIAGLTLFPAAAFIEIGRATAVAMFGKNDVSIGGGWFREPLILDENNYRRIQVVVTPKSDGEATFEIFSSAANSDDWSCHAGGSLRDNCKIVATEVSMDNARKSCPEKIDVDALQSKMRDIGLEYGPSFRGLITASAGVGEAFGELVLPVTDDLDDRLAIHPGILDAAFHLIGAAVDNGTEVNERFYLPIAYESAVLHHSPGVNAVAYAKLRSFDESLVVADITLWMPDGTLAVEILGLQARGMSKEQFQSIIGGRRNLVHHMVWRESVASLGAAKNGECLVIGGPDRLRNAVASALKKRDVICNQSDFVPDEISGHSIIDLRACYSNDTNTKAFGSEMSATGQSLQDTVELLRSVSASTSDRSIRVVLVTSNAQLIKPDDVVYPETAAIWGVAATAAAELTQIDVCIVDVDGGKSADAIVDALLRDDMESRSGVRDGNSFVPRLVSSDATNSELSADPKGVYALKVAQRGTISGVELQPARRASPGVGEIEIEVLTSGLNFRDVLNVLDMYPGPAGELGNECCGRVVNIGPDVGNISIGSIVTCIAEATYSSHVIAEAAVTFPVPPTLSLAQAAAFPIAQLTSYLALCEIGGMQAGDRVLIHAGAGGVGLAAAHLAIASGAIVFATAGSETKRDYLKSLGVEFVFDSRVVLPSETLLEATDGHGVDLLLNSLIGDSIDEGLRSLAPGGRFLEIGLREVRTDDEINSVREDIRYYPILLGDYCRDDPELVQRMFAELTSLLTQGKIPAPKVKSFPISNVVGAFDFMAKARHIGRIAVTHPSIGQMGLRPDSSYLITGGLGGIGLHIARWLADGGAQHIILMGRSDPGDDAQRTIDELRGLGIEMEIVRGDVADEKGLPLEFNAKRPPIRGVIHAAGIVDDSIFARLDDERLRRVLHPKVGGILNIVRATEESDLDFLAIFSSASSILGSPGQAAYAAANAYLDSAANRLHSAGRAAVSINWGAWDGGGMAAAVDEKTKSDWAARGIGVLSVEEGLRALEYAIGCGRSQVAVLPINWKKFFAANDGGSIPGILSELGQFNKPSKDSEAVSNSDFADKLVGLSDKQKLTVLTKKLREEVASVLGVEEKEIEVRAGLTEQGMDSLMAVELAGRLSRIFGMTLPTTFAFDYPTLGMLSNHIAAMLNPPDDDDDAATDVEEERPLTDFDELTEAQLEDALRQEIEDADITEDLI